MARRSSYGFQKQQTEAKKEKKREEKREKKRAKAEAADGTVPPATDADDDRA